MNASTSNQLRRTKILATLGPATDAPGVLEALLHAGVNVVRMNFSHGAPEHHAQRIEAVRAIAAEMDREVGVLADFQGPKIRVETFVDGKVELHQGDTFNLVCRADAPPGDATQVGMSYLGLVNDVNEGDLLLLDDGLLSLRVDAIDGDVIRTTVQNDGVLSNRK
ncbi:MAG: pyruvate kinase, partial [Lysobacteraceae bacterium]